MEDVVDEVYEFSAPKFYDFVDGETEEEAREAELWFETALSHAPSPFMMRVKAGRTAEVGSLCDFSDAVMEEPKCCALMAMSSNIIEGLAMKPVQSINMPQSLIETAPMKENLNCNIISKEDEESLRGFALQVPVDDKVCHVAGNTIREQNQSAPSLGAVPVVRNEQSSSIISSIPVKDECTPKPYTLSSKRDGMTSASHQQQRAKIAASGVQNPSTLKPTHHSQLSSSRARSIKPPPSAARNANMKNSTETPTLAQENQAIKRQKLEGGRSRQIINVKVQNLPHKSRFEVNGDNTTSTFCSSISKACKQERKIYVREPAAPFVSMAEMMKKFQSSTREMPLPQNLLPNAKPRLTLTTPKEPDFETAQRVRPMRVKSSAEIEEEMMAKMPKFKARPLNKKILQAPTLHAMPKSVPRPPEFQEFHLETMARASKAAEVVSSLNSMESSRQNDNQWRPHMVEPKVPRLLTAMRARPYKVKSFAEIEQEVLENIPKFKARPLNKKIFESKGDMGVFCNTKKQVTVPQEFHFAIDERIPPPAPAKIAELFDKLSLNSEPNHDHPIPKLTRPNPFHLQTEERGAEKERKLVVEVTLKQLEEERARIPKATPLPYSTDFPVIPPKPEPKPCTRPEPFQLESLVRHEEEMQREMEERRKKEREEAEMRIFKAQPIIREDPIPLPEKERKPLTQVQQFNLHLEHRAVDRAEFDKQIKEKELMYKRYRDESEAAKMVEEEKALKQLRRTLVPHAKPVPDFANPFIPEKSYKERTKPKSPKLRILTRKERLKSNVGAMKMAVASSSPAAQMR
ncbi:hypothetical protein Droror1_Dr00019287 [Drosera rotundifolia]